METQITNMTWTELMQSGAAIFGVLAVLVVLYYFLKLTTVSRYTKRYEFMSSLEIPHLKTASVLIAIAFAMLFNSFIAGLFETTFTFIAGLFLSTIVGVVVGYAIFAYFDVYYPFVLEDRLMKVRFRPRINPSNGNSMRLLNEHEEDVHLTEEMIKQEKSFAYDYDVWIDDESGFKKIERYDGHLHALICDECNFRTLKDYKEEIVVAPTTVEKGLLIKHFKCSNCGHREGREVTVAPLETEQKLSGVQHV
ncbi:MAG: hypothetical protein ACNS60_10635 [Candidatus Cyclobacteriaceae bacterium M2_1C_046]